MLDADHRGMVNVDLSEPPLVVAASRATHGVRTLVDRFLLPELWSLHVYSYRATLLVDDVPHAIRPGSVSLVAPGARIEYRYEGPSRHQYAHLTAKTTSTASGLGVVMSPGAQLPAISQLMDSAIGAATLRPERARADIWTVLLRLADQGAGGGEPGTDHVDAAINWITNHLTEPLTVRRVAAAVGLSPGHLARLVHQHTGTTILRYLRRQRIELATHLLGQTSMTISAVAAAVGIADLQAFNKACRAVTGHSPRQIRADEGNRTPVFSLGS